MFALSDKKKLCTILMLIFVTVVESVEMCTATPGTPVIMVGRDTGPLSRRLNCEESGG